MEFYRIVRMSDVGFRVAGNIFCRLTDLDFPNGCFDNDLNGMRRNFYRSVIDQMINKEINIPQYENEFPF
jgi:hypothetical protein